MRLRTLLSMAAILVAASGLVGADAPSVTTPSTTTNIVYSQSVEGFQLTLSTGQQIYPVGEPVYIDVWLKNTTDNTRQLLYPNRVEDNLSVNVLDDTGKEVPLTAEGKKTYIRPNFSSQPDLSKLFSPSNGIGRLGRVVSLPAHQDIHFHLLVNQLFDMSIEQNYHISVSLWVPRQDGKDIVTLASPSLNVNLSDPGGVLTPMLTNPAQFGSGGFGVGQTF